MMRYYREIIGAKILHFSQGDPLAFVSGVIIHPDTGKVEALWVKPVTIPLKNGVIQASDILEWKKHIYIKNDSVIADPAEVIRVADILGQGREFLGAQVEGESGQGYGRILDFDFNDKTLYLNQIHVSKSLLGIFFYGVRTFSWNSIVEVLPGKIIVADDATKKEPAVASSLKVGDLEAPTA